MPPGSPRPRATFTASTGLRDGFHLLHQLQERFWANAYPTLEPDDPESRYGPYDFLNSDKVLPLLIRSIPLTKGGNGESYCYSDFACMTQNDELLSKNPEISKQALRGQNKIVSEDWERVVAQTPRSFYEPLSCRARRVHRSLHCLGEKHGRAVSPRAARAINGPQSVEHTAGSDWLAGISWPTSWERSPPPCRKSWAILSKRTRNCCPVSLKATAGKTRRRHQRRPARQRCPQRTSSQRQAAPPPIADRDSAYQRLLEIIEFLRHDDPDNPVAYLLVRAYRIGEVYSLAGQESEGERPGPTSEVRQELRRMVADERWDEALEKAERSLGRPEGRSWLDAHRYAIQALEATDRQNAALGCRSLLRMLLRDFPDLVAAELDDGTAAADAKTRLWLESEGLLKPDGRGTEPVPAWPVESAQPTPAPAVTGDAQGEVNVTARATALAAAGRGAEAVLLLEQAMASATSGRERFLCELHLAETCLRLGNDQVALAFLEDLERQIDGFHLEDWEQRELCARVFGSLYHCLKERGPGDRLQKVYARLCKLDVRRAMQSAPAAGSR